MKDLWQRSIALLRQHPVLVFPLLGADLFGFATRTCCNNIALHLIQGLRRSQFSVLSHGLVSSHYLSSGQAVGMVVALSLVGQLIAMYLYACAALMVWSLVSRFLGAVTQQPGSIFGTKWVQLGTLLFCAFGLSLCFTVLPAVILPFAFPLLRLPISDLIPLMHGITTAALWIAYLVTAYWVTPRALRLMRADLAPEAVGEATQFALIAIAAALAIRLLCDLSVRSLLRIDEVGARKVAGFGASLLSALPYAVLFVALALALQDKSEPMVDGAPDSATA